MKNNFSRKISDFILYNVDDIDVNQQDFTLYMTNRLLTVYFSREVISRKYVNDKVKQIRLPKHKFGNNDNINIKKLTFNNLYVNLIYDSLSSGEIKFRSSEVNEFFIEFFKNFKHIRALLKLNNKAYNIFKVYLNSLFGKFQNPNFLYFLDFSKTKEKYISSIDKIIEIYGPKGFDILHSIDLDEISFCESDFSDNLIDDLSEINNKYHIEDV